MKKILIALLLVGSIGAAVAAVADLTGKWTGSVKGPDGSEYSLGYNFKTEGDKLTGTIESPIGTAAIENGKIKGDEFTFSSNLNGMEIPHKGKYYTDSVGIDIDYGGQTMHATLKRAK
ncbi:hypothetical protein GCM10027037_33640 [Mucilaginibacter koreensis]